jgi:hypothetical protein
MRATILDVTQATTAPGAPASPQAQQPAIPALPSRPGAPTGASPTVIVDRRGGEPVILGGGQGNGPAGTTASTQQPPDIPPELANVVREALQGAIPIFGIMLSMLAVMFIGFPLVRAYVRRQDKKLDAGMMKASDVAPQIRQLQESVDAMAVELERISEAQRFQARLMSEKAPAILPQQQGPRA